MLGHLHDLDALGESGAEHVAFGDLGGRRDVRALSGDGGLEEEGVAIEGGDFVWQRLRLAAQEHGVRSDEARVESEVGDEADGGELFDPADGWMDVDVGGLGEVAGRGGEEDGVGGGGQVGDGAGGFVGGEVLEDFDAGDEVVVAVEGSGEGGDAAVGADVVADFGDGEFGDVCAVSVDVAVAEGFDEEAHGAASVEDSAGG